MKPRQILGPEWIASERYDIVATIPAGVSPARLPEMLQSLLAERFLAKVHQEKRELPVYVLLPGKGSARLKQVQPNDGDDIDPRGTVNVAASGSQASVAVSLGHGLSYSFANNRLEATKLTMADFASNLERFADRPIRIVSSLRYERSQRAVRLYARVFT